MCDLTMAARSRLVAGVHRQSFHFHAEDGLFLFLGLCFIQGEEAAH